MKDYRSSIHLSRVVDKHHSLLNEWLPNER